MSNRISKEDYDGDSEVSMRSTCIRAHTGTIIIKNDTIISTGYNGSPMGEYNCCDSGICERYKPV